MNFRRQHRYKMPTLNTASLPDLIFTVLFFFMMVTHMRNAPLLVSYKMPQGHELTHVGKQAHVIYMYIGAPMGDAAARGGDAAARHAAGKSVVQIGGRYLTPAEITDHIASEQASLLPQDRRRTVVSIRADRDVRMEVINEVRQAIRRANVSRILMSAEGDSRSPKKKTATRR